MSVLSPSLPDFDLFTILTTVAAPTMKSSSTRYSRREAPMDPLLLAAAISSGPHVTRHHYHHHHEQPLPSEEEPSQSVALSEQKVKYTSKQAPRSQRLGYDSDKENQPFQTISNVPRRPRGASLLQQNSSASGPPPPSPFVLASTPATLSKPIIRNLPPAPLRVQCMARTRIPTPHGSAFLHLYRNNKDTKEHLAIVVDNAQFQQQPPPLQQIRSVSLDAKWSEDETELDRLTRGAYVGRLSPATQTSSEPHATITPSTPFTTPPLVRIHSECFTGETIGSMRCDCGEQLDEALRLISTSPHQRGAIIYLRQEGRGIGLLSKIRAYNLQDMGHDTVQANLLLGHGADERRYDIAAAIMRDLGLDQGVELLTNNPDKVASLEKEGIHVVKRQEMVPRSWKQVTTEVNTMGGGRIAGVGLIGGGMAQGPELEKYLRTKVKKMGHLLDLPEDILS